MTMRNLPSECSICKDPIKLYKPFYTITVHPHFVNDKRDYSGQKIFCPDCFHAYENFLIEHETIENHKRNMREMKGEL